MNCCFVCRGEITVGLVFFLKKIINFFRDSLERVLQAVAAALNGVLPLATRPQEASMVRWPFMADLTVMPVSFSH
jgi:hypothetical protein